MNKKFGKIAMFMAGALMLMAPAVAQAQESGPFYIAPKLLYSRQNTDSFSGKESFRGWNMGSTSYSGGSKGEDSFGGGLAIGYDFGATSNVPIRTELEYLIRNSTDSEYPAQRSGTGSPLAGHFMDTSYKTQTTTQTIFANVYYDFKNDSPFTPYIGGGLGGAYVKGQLNSKYYGRNSIYLGTDYNPSTPSYLWEDEASGNHNTWNFAWNLSAGAAYSFTDNIALDLSYRYSDLGTIDYGTRGNYYTHRVQDVTDPLNPQEVTVVGGGYKARGEADLVNHEVILGLRFSAW